MSKILKSDQWMKEPQPNVFGDATPVDPNEIKPGVPFKVIAREMKKASKERLFRESKNAFNY